MAIEGSWFSRIDRFGSVHMVRSQDHNFGCAMCSIAMVNFKVKKGEMFRLMAVGSFSDALQLAVKSEQEVITLYKQVAKESSHDFDKDGADPTLYSQVLPQLGLGDWEYVEVAKEDFGDAVVSATDNGFPVIGRVGKNGKGHAVVIDETHSFFGLKYLCVCDPWDGELRLVSFESGRTVWYDTNYQPISTGTFFGGEARPTPANTTRFYFGGGLCRRKGR